MYMLLMLALIVRPCRLKQTEKAVVHARRARRMRWICFIIVLIICAVVGIVVGVVVSNNVKNK